MIGKSPRPARGGSFDMGPVMMFLVRSAFWLSLVYAHMPFDDGQVVRIADEAKSAAVATAAGAAKASCEHEAASCRAVVNAAAGAILASSSERASSAQPKARATAAPKALRPSANSLTAADLETPWRGRRAKPGA
jgi:hypothetical protein